MRLCHVLCSPEQAVGYLEVSKVMQITALMLLYGFPWLVVIVGMIRVVHQRAEKEARSQEEPEQWQQISLMSVGDHHTIKERVAWIRR
jgi:hypothetical protein